jgi:hypothetical protein
MAQNTTTLKIYIELYVDKNPSMLQCLDMNSRNHPCTIVAVLQYVQVLIIQGHIQTFNKKSTCTA